jgi:hypothetical protein
MKIDAYTRAMLTDIFRWPEHPERSNDVTSGARLSLSRDEAHSLGALGNRSLLHRLQPAETRQDKTHSFTSRSSIHMIYHTHP